VFSLLLAIKLLDEYLFSSGFSSVSNSTPVIEKSLPHSFTAFIGQPPINSDNQFPSVWLSKD
jgi:hypothetical protein